MHDWTVSKAHMDADHAESERQRRIYEELDALEEMADGTGVIEGVYVARRVTATGATYDLDGDGEQVYGLDKGAAYWILRYVALYGMAAAIRVYAG